MSYTSLANIIPTKCFKVAWEVVGLIPQVMGSGNFPGIEVDKKKKNHKNYFLYLRVYVDKHLKIAVYCLYRGTKKIECATMDSSHPQ